jgi:phosphate starvation-inducible protein PhoH
VGEIEDEHDEEAQLVKKRKGFFEVDGIGFTFFQAQDVVRHPLVQKIVRAYDRRDRHRNREEGTP